MADEGDEFDGLDEMANLAEDDEDGIDAAAPLVAGLAIRGAMRGAARMPRPVRRQLVRAATVATRQIARRQGPRAAAAALPGVLRQARRTATRRGLPTQRLPQVVRQTAARVAQSPQLVRRMAQVTNQVRVGRRCVDGRGPVPWAAVPLYRATDGPRRPGATTEAVAEFAPTARDGGRM
jgi:hypothetical protein